MGKGGGSESRRARALNAGKKIPAPGIVVLKYDMLYVLLVIGSQRIKIELLPIDVAVVLPSAGIILVKLDTSKNTLFALDRANESNNAMHSTGNINDIAKGDVRRHGTAGCRRGHHVRG